MKEESKPVNEEGTASAKLEALLEQSAALHRHLCPRQVLGVRMGLLGGASLQIEVPQQQRKRLFVYMETDGCAADGVSVATGCWVGRRTMRLMDFGKVAATFVDRTSQTALRIRPRNGVRQMAEKHSEDQASRWHSMLSAYQTMSVSELFVVERVSLLDDLEGWISRPSSRVICQNCGEEIINQRQMEVEKELLCRACAGEAYYVINPGKDR